jgi:acetylornithine deacetylase/succinyl-diaminopimelate desuccinylase-like protein
VVRAGRLEDGADEVPVGELALPVERWAPRGGVAPDDWRLYARSASDDKGPIVGMLAALDALDDAGIPPAVNLKFFFEGEEEAGSEHLADLLRAHADLLAADLWLFCDGPVHASGRGQVVFGVRGVMGLELEVYGPLRALHSGHYGNWAPNPAARLAELLAGLRDGEGRILVPGFYDDVRPADEAERRVVAALPDPDEALRLELGIGESEAEGARLAERILLPALNVRGLAAGAVGGAAQNAVPTTARASIDVRLVPDQRPQRIRELVESHLRKQGWHLVAEEPVLATRRAHPRIARVAWDEGYPAYRVALGLPVSRAVVAAVSQAYGAPVLEVPTLGGSLPLHRFAEVLGVPLVVVPTVNADNSQHAPDENLRLGNLWRGIEVYASLMVGLGDGW